MRAKLNLHFVFCQSPSICYTVVTSKLAVKSFMKIIGPPDYYDFLAGIYGIDNNIVLDRRGGKKIFRREPIVELPQRFVWEQIQVAFCDVMYHGAVRWPHGKETVWVIT